MGATAVVRSPSSSSSNPSDAPLTQLTELPASASLLIPIGTVLAGRYEVLQVLGRGGMGAVYKVHDRELERVAALKTIRADLAGSPEMLQRFKQELVLARQVAHRNIVRLYDISEDSGVKFITMEYVEGEDFRSVLKRRGKLPPEEAIDVIRQICMALQAAHHEGIVHRDLKPQNIMQDKQGRVVVMDFGLARVVESRGMTQTGAMVGTMEYMSPEQAMGEKVDHTSDIYAAGLIFYELLTGRMPYEAESALASLMKRAQHRAIPPNEIDREVPRNLSAIVSHCIEPERGKRYQSSAEILADIEAHQPTAATMTSMVVPRRLPTAKRSKLPVIAAAVAIVLVIGGYAGWKKFGPTADVNHAPVSVLVADFENHTGDPVFDGTLEPMFNAALENAKFVNAYNRGEARKLAGQLPNHTDKKIDEQAARLIAASQNIGAVVTGSLSRRGDHQYKISVEAMNGLSGNSIASAEATVDSKDDVMLAIPKLVAPIRKALGDTTPESVQLAATQGSFQVGSLEAAHQYGQGMEAQFSGKMQDAFNSFSKAAELDPNFGRAYSGMASSARNLGRPDDAEKYFKMAMEHVDRMTERERFRTRGVYYLTIGNYPKCVEEYSSLLSQFTADNIGHSNLAFCYERLRNMPKAMEEARRAVEISPKGAVQRLNLSLFATYASDFRAGEEEARKVLAINPTYEQAYITLADAQIGQAQVRQAVETYQQLGKLSKSGASSSALGLAELASYEGRFGEAERILRPAIASDLASGEKESAADKLISLAYVHLSWGQSKQAIDAAERALTNSKRVTVRFLAARVFAETGEAARAHELAGALSAELLVERQTYGKIIEGQIALQNKDLQNAIQLFTDANKALDTWIGHFDLGRAYLAAGLFTEANSEFDKCIKRRGESVELMDDGPTYGYFPPIYYYQGLVLEGLKSPGFTESLRTYLTIRGQSSEDPMVSDARHRLPFSRQQ
jgi:tetratricopeptide (TPR) repeat protein/predicted Ser/Thr protein kinase